MNITSPTNVVFMVLKQLVAPKIFIHGRRQFSPSICLRTFCAREGWFYMPWVILFPFDLLVISGPIIHPHCRKGFPHKWHFALPYLLPASKSRLISHCTLCLHSSLNFGRKTSWNDLPSHRILIIIEMDSNLKHLNREESVWEFSVLIIMFVICEKSIEQSSCFILFKWTFSP